MTRSSTFALPKALAALVPRGKPSALSPVHTHPPPPSIPTEDETNEQIAHGKNHPFLPTLPGEGSNSTKCVKVKEEVRVGSKKKPRVAKISTSPPSIGPDACDAEERKRLLEPLVDFLAQSAIRLYENPTLPTHPITPPLQALPELSSFLLAMVTPTEMPLSSISLALLYLERLRAILPSTIRGGRGTAHRLALAALVLANKWNDDDSFGVRTWSKLVRRWFARGEVELMEAEMLARMSWRLFVPRDEWDEFLERLEDRLDLPLREAIGPELCNGNLVLDVMKMEDDLSEEEIVSEEIVEEEEEEEEEHVLMDEERMGNRVEDEGNDGKRQSTPPGLMVAAVQAKATLSWTPDANALGVIEGMVASREYAGQRLKDALRDATEKRVNSGRFSLPPQPSSAGSDTTAVDSVEQEPKEALSIHAMDSGIVGMDFRSKPY